MTWQQEKYLNKLKNKLEHLKGELRRTHQEIYNTTYLAELQADLLNPQKPSKELQKPTTTTKTPHSEMFIDQKEPPTLSKDQHKVHNHIYSFYKDLFSPETLDSSYMDLEGFMEGIETEKITPEENIRLQQPISKEETAKFIKSMSIDVK